jgi:hypothetical protein
MSKKYLRRYTDLPYLFQMLTTSEIILLSPSKWEDRNDAQIMEGYRREKKLGCVLALCMTSRSSTFHHWKIFAPGSSGVCIKFRRRPFQEWANDQKLTLRDVDYQSIKEARNAPPVLDDRPYTKRRAFRDEGEVRLLYESGQTMSTKAFRFPLELIKEIIINPWVHPDAFPAVKAVIRAVTPKASRIDISRTRLLDNPRWQRAVSNDA